MSGQLDDFHWLVGEEGGRWLRLAMESRDSVLAASRQFVALGPANCYLSDDQPRYDPALECFEVIEVLPFDLKRLKRLLRERGIERLEIKKRGPTETPETIRRRLDLRGDEEAALVVTAIGRSVRAILARRVSRDLPFSSGCRPWMSS
jgi:hypothetical protein